MMILEELSTTGARLIGDAPLNPGTEISFDVPGAGVARTGTIRHVQALKTSVAVLFSMGVEFPSTRRADWWSFARTVTPTNGARSKGTASPVLAGIAPLPTGKDTEKPMANVS